MSSGIGELFWPKIMCCMCFDVFDKVDLYMDEEGWYHDVCVPCHEAEQRMIKQLKEASQLKGQHNPAEE